MKSEQIKERIEKAQIKLEKRKGTITKKQDWIVKRINKIEKLGATYVDDIANARKLYGCGINNDVYWLYCDIEGYKDDIKRAERDCIDIDQTIASYQYQLKKALENENKLNNIPQILKDYQTYITDIWIKQDMHSKSLYKKQYKILGYNEFIKEYSYNRYEHMLKSDSDIKKENIKNGESLILNLIERTREQVGTITDCSYLSIDSDNQGFSVINGFIIGENGKCEVESIIAGGYNIQRMHVRVLVKKRG